MFEPIIIVLLFAAAWLLARVSAWVALRVLVWNDRRHAETDLSQSGRMTRLKRRETQVSIVRAAITYLGFVTAAVLSVGQLIGGIDRLTALAGASFLLILVRCALARRRTHDPHPDARAAGDRRGRLSQAHAPPDARRRDDPHPQLADPFSAGAAERGKGAPARGLRHRRGEGRRDGRLGRVDPAPGTDDVHPSPAHRPRGRDLRVALPPQRARRRGPGTGGARGRGVRRPQPGGGRG